jgi:hypothetical protein
MKKSTTTLAAFAALFALNINAAPIEMSLSEMNAVVAGAAGGNGNGSQGNQQNGTFVDLRTVTTTTTDGPGNSENTKAVYHNPNIAVTTTTTTYTDTYQGSIQAGNLLSSEITSVDTYVAYPNAVR